MDVIVTCRGVYENYRVEFVTVMIFGAKSEQEAKDAAWKVCQRKFPSAIFWVAEFVEEMGD